MTATYASVRKQTAATGVYLVSTLKAEGEDRWWLRRSPSNWTAGGQPGRTLQEISDDLDEREWAKG